MAEGNNTTATFMCQCVFCPMLWGLILKLMLQSLQLSTVSSGRQSGFEFRSDSPTAKAQKVGCWHSNGSRNTDHTFGVFGCVWQEVDGSGHKGRVCLEGGSKQANTLRTKKIRYRIYDRYGWEPRRHTHSHQQTYGGRRGHFGFHRPVILSCFVTWPKASSSKRVGGGREPLHF